MDYIQDAVNKVVNKSMSRDPFEIAKALGIKVFYHPLSKIKGFILSVYGENVIVINSKLSEEAQRVVLAHELGHYILSPSGSGYFFISQHTLMESQIEYEANRFAIELLTGEAEPAEGETIAQYAARLNIPPDMIRYIKYMR